MYIGVNTEPSPAHSLGYIRDQIEWADVIKRQGHYLSIYLSLSLSLSLSLFLSVCSSPIIDWLALLVKRQLRHMDVRTNSPSSVYLLSSKLKNSSLNESGYQFEELEKTLDEKTSSEIPNMRD